LLACHGTQHICPRIDPRFIYGELRLSRLNKIYFLYQTPLRRYMSKWQQYGTFFRDNLALLTSSIVYIAIVLTAMQVGLATDMLRGNNAFQSASYGFALFSILGPLVAFGLVMAVFAYMFVDNLLFAVKDRNRRLAYIIGQDSI
jgi:hypothetical protein